MAGSGSESSRRDRRLIAWRSTVAPGGPSRIFALLALIVLVPLTGAGVAAATTGRAAQLVPPDETVLGPQDHIHICHAEGNGGYHLVYPNIDSVVHGQGHGGHPRDIIPPFRYDLGHGAGVQTYPGKNWNAETGNADGEAIWTNTCVRPAPPGRIDVFVSCVDVHGATYDASFGYVSGDTADVPIPVGANNRFTTGDENRGQPTVFGPGLHLVNFTVTGIPTSETLTWAVISGRSLVPSTAEASATFGRPCTETPDPTPDVPIGVFVTCVVDHGSTYDAIFGYESDNADTESIPVGEGNFFSPGSEDRGQPDMFAPGRHEDAVTVTGIPASEELTWTLVWSDTRTATASADFEPKCEESSGGTPSPPPEPPPPPAPPPVPPPLPIGVFAACVTNNGSHYDATFGYTNENVDVVTVPIGPGNAVSPGPAGQGQPEAFYPGFLYGAFTVHGVSASHAVTWTVSVDGQERTATATAAFPDKCLTAPIHPAADAALRKTAAPARVMVGGRVRFTIHGRNTGSKILRPAEVTDTLPADRLQVLSATSTLGRCHVTTAGGSHVVHCRATALAPGQSFTIHITARATASGSASDHAAVVGLRHAVASATVSISGPPPPPFTG